MNGWNWDRWSPFSGVLFVICFVLGFLVPGDGPKPGDSASTIISFFETHRGRSLAGTMIFGLGVVFFLWFAGAIATRLRESGAGQLAATVIATGGAIVGFTLLIATLNGALAFSVASQGDEGVVRALNELTWAAETMTSFVAGAFVATACLGFARTRLVPDWLAWGGLAASVIILLGGTAWAKDGFWAPDGAFAFIGLILFLAWALATALVLTWWPRRAAMAQPAATPA